MILSLEKFFFGKIHIKISRGSKTEPGNCPQCFGCERYLLLVEKTTRKRMSIRSLTEFPPKPNVGCPRGNFFFKPFNNREVVVEEFCCK